MFAAAPRPTRWRHFMFRPLPPETREPPSCAAIRSPVFLAGRIPPALNAGADRPAAIASEMPRQPRGDEDSDEQPYRQDGDQLDDLLPSQPLSHAAPPRLAAPLTAAGHQPKAASCSIVQYRPSRRYHRYATARETCRCR